MERLCLEYLNSSQRTSSARLSDSIIEFLFSVVGCVRAEMWSNVFGATDEEYFTDTLHADRNGRFCPAFSSVLTRSQVEARFDSGAIVSIDIAPERSSGSLPKATILIGFFHDLDMDPSTLQAIEQTIRIIVKQDVRQRTDRINEIVIDCSHHSNDLMSFLHKLIHKGLLPEFHFEAVSIFYYDRKTNSLILGATTGIRRQEKYGLKKSDLRYFADSSSYTAKAWSEGREIVENVFSRRPLKHNTSGEMVDVVNSRIYAPLRRWKPESVDDFTSPLGVIRAVNANKDCNYHPLTRMEAARLRLFCDAASVITERYLKTASILYDQERATHGYNTDLAAIRYAAQNIERWLGRLNVHPPRSPSQAAAMQEVEYRVRDIMAVQDNMASQLMTVMHHSNSTSFIVKVSDAEFCYKPYTDIIMRIISAKRGMSECYARNELHLTFNGRPKAEDDFIRIPALRVSIGDLFLAFRNLVENAIKYSIKGMRPTLDISWSNLDNRYIEFHFSDCGIGVPVAEQPLLMREGFRGRKAQELQLRGNGLGLTVSKTVIERAGGTIYFRKKPAGSKGACFVLRVPILQEKQHEDSIYNR